MSKRNLRELNRQIGKDLKFLRRLYDINQEEIAKVLGVIQSAVSRIETGHQQLSAAQFIAVRQYIVGRPNLFLDRIGSAINDSRE